MTKKLEKLSKQAETLDKFVQRGIAMQKFKKLDAYKLIMDWIDKECDIDKVLGAKKEERDEGIGYIRFGRALKKQIELWEKRGNEKQKGLNRVLEEIQVERNK